MFNKVFWVMVVLGLTVIAYVLITAEYGAIRSIIGIASSDPSAGNYPYYKAAVDAAPIWLYAIPAIVGIVTVVLILREPERP